MLLGHELFVYTDHENLTFSNFTNGQMLQWCLIVEEFGRTIPHISGKNNILADSLSRIPTYDTNELAPENLQPEILSVLKENDIEIFPFNL